MSPQAFCLLLILMKRFEFKLQAVLTLRQRAEQAALEKFARASQLRSSANLRLQEADMTLSDSRRLWLNALADGCPAARASQFLAYSHSLEDRKRLAEQSLCLAEVELHRASQSLLAARQQREALESLHARQHQRYVALVQEEVDRLNHVW